MNKAKLASIIIVFLGVTLYLAFYLQSPSVPQFPIVVQPTSKLSPDSIEEIEIRIWVHGIGDIHQSIIESPFKAAELVTEYRIKPVVEYETEWGGYKDKFASVAEAGQAPDIVMMGLDKLPAWIEVGYLQPFNACRARHSEFDDVIERLWSMATWENQIWGVPARVSTTPLFYNKSKLKEIGWSDEDIATLPEKIRQGEFTMDDIIATSREAIDKGVIEPGFGYWNRPVKQIVILQEYTSFGGQIYNNQQDKMIITKNALERWFRFRRQLIEEKITPEDLTGPAWNPGGLFGNAMYNDTVLQGRVLFWNGHLRHWHGWVKDYVAKLGGNDYLYNFVGYALQPSGIRNQFGNTYLTGAYYVISSQKASGRKNQDIACSLLAKLSTPELNTLNVVEIAHLGVLNSQADYFPYTQFRHLSENRYMLDYGWFMPLSPLRNRYVDIIWKFMIEAESSEKTADQAAAAIEMLQRELGNALIIE